MEGAIKNLKKLLVLDVTIFLIWMAGIVFPFSSDIWFFMQFMQYVGSFGGYVFSIATIFTAAYFIYSYFRFIKKELTTSENVRISFLRIMGLTINFIGSLLILLSLLLLILTVFYWVGYELDLNFSISDSIVTFSCDKFDVLCGGFRPNVGNSLISVFSIFLCGLFLLFPGLLFLKKDKTSWIFLLLSFALCCAIFLTHFALTFEMW